MARELAATMKEGGSFSTKRGFQDGLEVEDDLTHAKRRCVNTKTFETEKAIDQPRREQ